MTIWKDKSNFKIYFLKINILFLFKIKNPAKDVIWVIL